MKIARLVLVCSLIPLFSLPSAAQPKKKKLLAIGAVKGWQHDSVSHALGTIWKIGQESGLYDTYIRTDTQLVTKKSLPANAKNLNSFDAIFFYTTGELDMDDSQKADFLSFIRDDGKGFLGAHSANDTFYKWPAFGELIGGYFDGHPWNQFNARLIVEAPDFPGMQHLARPYTVYDEIYQAKEFSRERVRVLLRLDVENVDLTIKGVNRTDKDFAVAWARNYGKGRIYYNGLGHREDVWDKPEIQKMWLGATKWAMGLVPGDAAPRPKPAK